MRPEAQHGVFQLRQRPWSTRATSYKGLSESAVKIAAVTQKRRGPRPFYRSLMSTLNACETLREGKDTAVTMDLISAAAQ